MDPISAVIGFIGGLIDTPAEQQERQNLADANKLKAQELKFRQQELMVKSAQSQQFLLFGLIGVVVVGGVFLLKD
jgi:glutathione synthase/RimK-type ligase-like ATP-grasp enzyme